MSQPTNDEVRRQLGPTGKEKVRGVMPPMPAEEMKAHMVGIHMQMGKSYMDAVEAVFGEGSFLRFWMQAGQWAAAQAEIEYGPNWREVAGK